MLRSLNGGNSPPIEQKLFLQCFVAPQRVTVHINIYYNFIGREEIQRKKFLKSPSESDNRKQKVEKHWVYTRCLKKKDAHQFSSHSFYYKYKLILGFLFLKSMKYVFKHQWFFSLINYRLPASQTWISEISRTIKFENELNYSWVTWIITWNLLSFILQDHWNNCKSKWGASHIANFQ